MDPRAKTKTPSSSEVRTALAQFAYLAMAHEERSRSQAKGEDYLGDYDVDAKKLGVALGPICRGIERAFQRRQRELESLRWTHTAWWLSEQIGPIHDSEWSDAKRDELSEDLVLHYETSYGESVDRGNVRRALDGVDWWFVHDTDRGKGPPHDAALAIVRRILKGAGDTAKVKLLGGRRAPVELMTAKKRREARQTFVAPTEERVLQYFASIVGFPDEIPWPDIEPDGTRARRHRTSRRKTGQSNRRGRASHRRRSNDS